MSDTRVNVYPAPSPEPIQRPSIVPLRPRPFMIPFQDDNGTIINAADVKRISPVRPDWSNFTKFTFTVSFYNDPAELALVFDTEDLAIKSRLDLFSIWKTATEVRG